MANRLAPITTAQPYWLALAPARLAEPPLTVQLRKERTIGATKRAFAFPIVKGTILRVLLGSIAHRQVS